MKSFPTPLYKKYERSVRFSQCRQDKKIRKIDKYILKFFIIVLSINKKYPRPEDCTK